VEEYCDTSERESKPASGNPSACSPAFPSGRRICEVEIEHETGRINMLLYVVVDDFGSMIDLLLLFGQMNGGVAQGVNQAMLSAPFSTPRPGSS
jgi:aerobic carbon-monoxide dehydrogenase large subunit